MPVVHCISKHKSYSFMLTSFCLGIQSSYEVIDVLCSKLWVGEVTPLC